MTYLIIKILHIFSVLIYGGFLFTDNLILMRMQKTLSKEKYDEVRSYFKEFTRVLVPKALIFGTRSTQASFPCSTKCSKSKIERLSQILRIF